MNRILFKAAFFRSALLLFSIFSLSSTAQVNLTASSGTLTGSFTTLNSAFAAINAGTHQGVIAITIVNNTIETSPPTPLLQSAGASSYTSITITPTGGDWTIS